MSSGPTPAPPWRGSAAPPSTPPGPAWRLPARRAAYRPRWRWLALVAGLGLAALAVVTWVVFWIRPPAPARLVILHAGYDRTLAVPVNPYGKSDARELATLVQPGSWLGTRSRLTGGPTSTLTRNGLPDLSAMREKCIVVFIAAHGGRDRDGPFLFPEDSTGEASDRVRFKTLLEQFARLPASKQKFLIIDATREPAFTELGLVHNDFAAAVEEMDSEIAAVPNLAVLLSSGRDERSWTAPEWGTSCFTHFTLRGLNGAADADGNRRVTVAELVSYVTPRVSDWVRDNRGARQVPVLLPKSDGENRVLAMHLVSVDEGSPAAPAAPEPFDPPPELEAQWAEYRELAQATPPPTAYTPHLWRQYEAWVLRHEQHILANDLDGAKIDRANAAEVRRKIEAARTLDISPQTVTLQAAVGGQPYVAAVPDALKRGVTDLERTPPASRAKRWAELRIENGDTEATRLLWCRALIEWVAGDPVPRLATARDLIPLIADGFAVRPAEVNFLAMLARHLPPPDKKDVLGPLLTLVLHNRLRAEERAALLESPAGRQPDKGTALPYPYAESFYPWIATDPARYGQGRREVEDLCFSTSEVAWKNALVAAALSNGFDFDAYLARRLRDTFVAWHRAAHELPAVSEWLVRSESSKRGTLRDAAWQYAHTSAATGGLNPATDAARMGPLISVGVSLRAELDDADGRRTADTRKLLQHKPEFEGAPTARADAVKWWNSAEAVLAAPPVHDFSPAERAALAREFRRVSRQLLVTNETRPEPLAEVSPAKAREVAFEAAKRRGELLLGWLGGSAVLPTLTSVRPGEDFAALTDRLAWFAFRADGRQSLATFGSRCGELFDAATDLATRPDGYRRADRWVRISPAHAAVSDAPIDRTRRENVRGYLAWQAQRTFADHWYGEAGTRYYHLAVQRLASDANALVAAFPPKDEPFKPLLGPERPFPVVPRFPNPIAVTDEPNPAVRVTFAPQPTKDVEGFPAFWIDPKVRTPVSTDPGGTALVRSLTRPALPQPLTPKAQREQLAVAGFFRGRTLDASTSVDFYPVPDRTAVSTPLPQSVSIAVRADVNARKRYGLGAGAVAIVLDCSGSMGRDPKDPRSIGLYPEALDALAKLLKGLPPGTVVNLWTFGQRTQGIKVPEQTIHELLAPTELPLDAEPLIEEVLQLARGLEPWHESPIVRSAVTAKNRIAVAKVPFKAVVLLSDAIDNRFAVDPEYGAKMRTIGDVLRAEFPPAEVAFGVVAFPVGKAEQPAQAEFKIVEKLIPAGKFVTPEKVQDLIDWLRTGLNPRVRFALEALTSDSPPLGALMAGSAGADNWYTGKLAPGAYRLTVVGDSTLAEEVRLLPGDRLLLDLTENNKVLSLRRHWFADGAQAVAKAGLPAGVWRMALFQNRAKGGKLELFAAIDANPALLNPFTPTRIADAWFEVTPSVPQPEPVALRWRADGGFPAPCWSLALPGWPNFPGTAASAAPRLSAWWSPEPFLAAAQIKAPATGALDLRDRAVTIAGTAVTLDTVTLEEHEVEVSPGMREKRTCLVVRLTHTNADPVFVRTLGAQSPGRAVRFYKGANKATCLFWWPGLDVASVKQAVTGFAFVPLNAALRGAEKAGRHLTLTAPAPSETSARPEPPTK